MIIIVDIEVYRCEVIDQKKNQIIFTNQESIHRNARDGVQEPAILQLPSGSGGGSAQSRE